MQLWILTKSFEMRIWTQPGVGCAEATEIPKEARFKELLSLRLLQDTAAFRFEPKSLPCFALISAWLTHHGVLT